MGMDQFSPYTDSRPYGLNPAGVPVGLFNSPIINKIIPATGSDTNLDRSMEELSLKDSS